MVKMSILMGLASILSACFTPGDVTPSPRKTSSGYVPFFSLGECAVVNPASLPEGVVNDGTQVKVIFVDYKYEGYVFYMEHPVVSKKHGPSILGLDITKFELLFNKTECSDELKNL